MGVGKFKYWLVLSLAFVEPAMSVAALAGTKVKDTELLVTPLTESESTESSDSSLDVANLELTYKHKAANSRKIFGYAHPQTINAMWELSQYYLQTQKYSQAENMLRYVNDARARNPTNSPVSTNDIREAYAKATAGMRAAEQGARDGGGQTRTLQSNSFKKTPYQGYGTGWASSMTPELTAAERAHMRRNADLYNRQLSKMWKPASSNSGASKISFQTDKNGNMFNLKVQHSSGNLKFDKAALRAVGAMVPMRDFGGEPACDYFFESTFSVGDVQTEYKSCKMLEVQIIDLNRFGQ